MKKTFITPKCGLDLLRIRTTQRDMLIKVTDEMVIENQIVNMLLDQIIEIIMHSDNHPDISKIRNLLDNQQKEAK